VNNVDNIDERKCIIETCHRLQKMNFVFGTWGNVSMRVGDIILLTPSKVCYNVMKPQDIVEIDLDGNKISGEYNPTSEKEVHRNIYINRNEIRAVVHAHSEKCMAVSAININEVPPLVEEMSQLLGGSIPLTKEYVPAEHHADLGLAVGDVILDRNGCIMRNHGGVSCGRTMEEAVLSSKVMEKCCGIYLSIMKCSMKIISKEYVNSERYRYLYKYGKEKT
jgi:L-ribulose-5-phosphate 4-epimerase